MIFLSKKVPIKYVFASAVLTFFVFLLLFNFYFRNRVLSGIHVLGQDVSMMTEEEVTGAIEKKAADFMDSEIVLAINDPGKESGEVKIHVKDLGVTIDTLKTSRSVYGYGKRGNFVQDSLSRLNSIWNSHEIDPVSTVDFSALYKTVGKATFDHGVFVNDARDATIIFEREPKILAEQEGRAIDMTSLAVNLRGLVNNASVEPLVVNILPTDPLVKKEGADRALDKIKRLENQKIVLTFGNASWKLSGNVLFSILKFYPKGMENGYASRLGDVVVKSFGDNPQRELDVSVSNKYIREFVSDIAKSVDQEKVDATLIFDGGRVREFKPAQDGQKLDVDTTYHLISDSVSVDNISGEQNLVINLPVRVVKAKIANDEINSLGIKELIGRGVSYFAGSIPNRAYNVNLGASRINGTIIKSGETFSFNKTVGEVSGATGYKQAYVISSGRTVLDDGGGICQVSTTVFRAALNAGLPIVTRTAHAYRVGYYEQRGFKPGLDATVFAPSVDFVFKNDTDHSVLVQTVVDSTNAKLAVSIYGTSDGRKVEISDPVVSNIKPAPPDVFQDDPTLPKGTKKQVDFSAQGATSVFSRKVYKGDKVLIDESFKSVFRPWQAVYLVGTGG